MISHNYINKLSFGVYIIYMDSKQQILSYIQRTNQLLKTSYIKTNDSDNIASIINLGENTLKKVSKVSSKPLSQMQTRSVTTYPRANKTSETNSRKSSPARNCSLERSNLEFNKKLLSALNELAHTKEMKIKKNSEFIQKEDKSIQILRGLIENQKKAIKPIKKTSSFTKYEKFIQEITKESAEDLMIIEKKCTAIFESNKQMEKILEETKLQRIHNTTPVVKDLYEIYDLLSKNNYCKEKNEIILLHTSFSNENYAEYVNELVDKWIKVIDLDNAKEITENLCYSLQKEAMLLQQTRKSLQSQLEERNEIKNQLEEKINLLSKGINFS